MTATGQTSVRTNARASVPPSARLDGVTVRYGHVRALDDVTLDVAAGAALALLGPSGAGKTTLLHALAGFTAPEAGTVRIGCELVAGDGRFVPPEARRVGVVFQHYALWPHLSAVDTVAYPLRREGVSRREARTRALELLDLLGVRDLADRRPSEMSGGQQQRVGVARALARDAAVYCFDEPTAHLDTALRALLQEQVAERRRATGAAAVYATHDAGEALALADTVALLRDGHVVQVGTPAEVYERPTDRWAALLTGPASVLQAPLVNAGRGGLAAEIGDVRVPVDAFPPSAEHEQQAPGPSGHPGDRVPRPSGQAPRPTDTAQILVRPEWAELGGPLHGVVRHAWYRGPHTDHRLEVTGGTVDVRAAGPPQARPGDTVTWALRRGWVLATGDDAG